MSRDLVVGGHPKPHIWNQRPQFAYSLYNFYGATTTIKESLHTGSCSGQRGNVLSVGNCCYVAVCRRSGRLHAERRGTGHIVSPRALLLVILFMLDLDIYKLIYINLFIYINIKHVVGMYSGLSMAMSP